jgi:hypothetical protein
MKLEKDLFIRAHQWTSFSPEKRGERLYSDMSQMLASDLAELGEKSGNYAAKFEARLALYLHRKSRTASAMITGPAKFPFASNAKKMDSEMRAWDDLMKWRERYIKAVNRERTKSPEEEIDSTLAEIDRMTTAHALLKQCNKLKTIEERRDFLVEHYQSFKGVVRVRVDLTDELKLEHWTLTYLNRRIKERQSKLETMRARIERKATFEPIQFEGGSITIEEDRVMIKHDAKPSREVIDAIKARGFRWSPNFTAWVRKHTAQAIYDAQNIIKATTKNNEVTA